MHLNKTKIILIVMIVSTLILGGVAVFIGWRLQQNQISKPTQADSCTCPSGYEGPDQYNKCWSRNNPGQSVAASCTGTISQSASSTPSGNVCDAPGNQTYCTSYCCSGTRGCNQICEATGSDNKGILKDQNGGPSSCPNGNNSGGEDAKAGRCATTVACNPACTGGKVCVEGTCRESSDINCSKNTDCATGMVCSNRSCVDANTAKNSCLQRGGCWNDGVSGESANREAMGCTQAGAEWCGPGNCVPGRNDLCKYRCVNNAAVNTNTACQAGSCQPGYCLVLKTGHPQFGECVSGSKESNDLCKGESGRTCRVYDCGNSCDYNGGSECRGSYTEVPCDQAVLPRCGQIDYNCAAGQDCGGENINSCSNCGGRSTSSTTPSSTPSSSSVSSITTTSLKAKLGGRVYCQDTGGQPIPIEGAVVGINIDGTVVNATTDADGFYVSSEFNLPTEGANVGVDVTSLPMTFNNGLDTSQLQSKSAENCAKPSVINGCSGETAPGYYCTLENDGYEACVIKTQPSDTDKGFGGFNIKYANCSSSVSECGDSTVDVGEQCDPVGTVGQCSNGGKCLNGCVCPTCNSKCSENDDCQNGFVCSAGVCRNPSCETASDCSCRTIPGTALFNDSRLSIVFAFVLIFFGILLLRSNSFMLRALPLIVNVAGIGVLKYVDPDVAKKMYEKNVLEKGKE